MKFEQKFKIVMYLTAAISLLCMMISLVSGYIFVEDIHTSDNIWIEEGRYDLSDYNFPYTKPLNLQGEWIAYPDVYLKGDTVDYNQLSEAVIKELPIRDLNKAKGTYTYQIFLKFDFSNTDLQTMVCSIPFVSDDVRVFVNGETVAGVSSNEEWSAYASGSTMFSLKDTYDPEKEYQEFIISVNEDPSTTTLYDRQISISTIRNTLAIEKIVYVVQGILIGMMLISILVGTLYIIILPTYSALTFMNLFDMVLMTHLLFNMSSLVTAILHVYFLGEYADLWIRRLDITFLFLAGFLGNILAKVLYDPEHKSCKFFDKPINYVYLLFAIITFIFPQVISLPGIIAATVLLIVTFVGVVLKFISGYKQGIIDVYRKFHLAKTMYLGVIILLDILTLNYVHRPQTTILIGYMIFFIIHLIIRAYEYRLPYLKVAKLNEDLEKTVEERTSELRETNEILRNLTERDALTNAYNRLYFEEQLLMYLEEFQCNKRKAIHLCIFDLDNFKVINDTYGHIVGDDQLIETVQLMNETVPENVIISRIGGEEFTLLFLDDTDEHVLEVVEQVRYGLEEMAKEENRTTGSFGVSKVKNGITRKDLFAKTDQCLYYSKEHGKNRITYEFDEVNNIR